MTVKFGSQITMSHIRRLLPATLVLAISGLALAQERRVPERGYKGWRVYGGTAESIRYSALTQIHRGNVQRLELAWTHDTGDATEDSEMPCNPIVIGDVLYALTPTLRIFALEAATGRLIWRVELPGEFTRAQRRLRGLAWWGNEREGRIFATKGPYLYALDARNGRLIPGFGDSGRVDLRVGLGRPPETLRIWARTPGVVYGDLLIQGSVMSEGLPAPPGDVPRLRRAFRRAALVFPHDPPSGRVWLRDLAGGRLEIRRSRQQLGGHERGFAKGNGLHPDGVGLLRLLRRQSPRRQSLCQFADCTPGRDRRARLAFPVRPPRSLGSGIFRLSPRWSR